MEKYKIVYIQIERAPINTLSRLFFFTEENGKIFWGTDNNPINSEDIERWLLEKKIFKLKNPIFIDEDQTLLIGYPERKIYVSNKIKEQSRLQGEFLQLVE